MEEAIVLHQGNVPVKKSIVTLRLVVPGQAEMDYLKNYVHSLKLETDPEELYFPKDYGVEDQQPNTEDLTRDLMRLSHWILSERARWDIVFGMISRKQNGTFAKGRVVNLHRVAVSETGYSEESFGFYGYTLRIKNIDDTTAVLELANVVRKYDEDRYSMDPPL